MTRQRWAAWLLVLAAYLGASCLFLADGFAFRGPPGTGLERPAAYRRAIVTDRDLLVAFTVGYAPNPRPYGLVEPTSRMGWGKIALADLGWYGPNEPPARAKHAPSFADDMETFEREARRRLRPS